MLVRAVVRAGFDRLIACYEDGLRRDPTLAGRVTVVFVIQPDGTVKDVHARSTTLGDDAAVECILDRFRTLVFPRPPGGILTVEYPVSFTPGQDEEKK